MGSWGAGGGRGAVLVVKGGCSKGGRGGVCTGSQGSLPLWVGGGGGGGGCTGSQWWVSKRGRGCTGSQGLLPLWVSKGALSVVKGHYSGGFPGGCIRSQGSLPLWVSKGQY